MHKKDRPMLSVTALLYGSTAPNNQVIIQQAPNNNNTTLNSSVVLSGINNNNNSNNTTNNSGNGLTLSGNSTPSPTPKLIGGNTMVQSPNSGSIVCDNNNNTTTSNHRFPPNHPLSGSKHLCAICEDRASGKHYGVYSCEGCKGFFKRTVRKDLTYLCRDEKNCIVDKRQRNRCQYCRYQKCLQMGMKREAVQEERQRNKPDNEVESSTSATTNIVHLSNNNQDHYHLTIERLLEAEKQIEVKLHQVSPNEIATKEIELLFRWIRMIPYFSSLKFEDQVLLLKTGWNELLIAEFSYRSTCKHDALLLANGVMVSKQNAMVAGIGDIFARVLNELVVKMREMSVDKSELGCLRAIVLFNPAIKSLKDPNVVERLRDRIYSLLENHCKTWYQDKTSRFAKLLVRLPALRSIGLKCVEHLFFQKLLAETNRKETIDTFITKMLKSSFD